MVEGMGEDVEIWVGGGGVQACKESNQKSGRADGDKGNLDSQNRRYIIVEGQVQQQYPTHLFSCT